MMIELGPPGPHYIQIIPFKGEQRRAAATSSLTKAASPFRPDRGWQSVAAAGPKDHSAADMTTSSAPRADLEQFAIVTGFFRNPELAAAIEPCHDRHHRDDVPAPRIRERVADLPVLTEPDQIARGRERQLEAAGLASVQRLARRHPDRVG